MVSSLDSKAARPVLIVSIDVPEALLFLPALTLRLRIVPTFYLGCSDSDTLLLSSSFPVYMQVVAPNLSDAMFYYLIESHMVGYRLRL